MLVGPYHPALSLSVPFAGGSSPLRLAGQSRETSRQSLYPEGISRRVIPSKQQGTVRVETSAATSNSNTSSSRSSRMTDNSSSSYQGARWDNIPNETEDDNSGFVRSTSIEHSPVESSTTTSDGRKYRLEVVQHPERTAELVGGAVLSRIPLSPPLVVQVTVEDGSGSPASLHNDMPFLTAHLWLYDGEGIDPVDLAEGPPSPGGSILPQRLLYGTLVSSLHHFKDLQGQPRMYFIFPDVSVRRRGSFRLMVTMMRLTSPTGSVAVMAEGERNATLASVLTNRFEVVSQSEYIAPNATPLTSSLHRQGARMY